MVLLHARIQKECHRWSNFDNVFYVFLVDEGGGREDLKPLKTGHHRPPAKRHLNGVSLADR